MVKIVMNVVHGVGFAVRKTLLKTTCLRSGGSARILMLHLKTTKGPLSVLMLQLWQLQQRKGIVLWQPLSYY